MLLYVNIGCSAIVSALQFHYSIITLHNDVECFDVKSSSQFSMLMIYSSVNCFSHQARKLMRFLSSHVTTLDIGTNLA